MFFFFYNNDTSCNIIDRGLNCYVIIFDFFINEPIYAWILGLKVQMDLRILQQRKFHNPEKHAYNSLLRA